MSTKRHEPDVYLYPEQIGANVWLERYGKLLRTIAAAQPQRRAVQLWTTKGPLRLKLGEQYAVWTKNPEPYVGDPNAPF